DDATYAAELGADFLGFIFVPGSPRYIDPKRAAKIISQVQWAGGKGTRHDGRPIESHPLHCVGVFRNASTEEIKRVTAIAGNEYVQLHGDEPDEVVREVGKPVIRSVAVPSGATGSQPVDITTDTRRAESPSLQIATSAEWLLFDTGGGTGRAFDWSLMSRVPRSKRFFLAGGLTPDNVAEAIRVVRPDGVDVSTGVESAPGVKDPAKMRKFFDQVRQP
ncbi:MAG TPA: phosphoribosylanthranilate isomerase, partial [Thermoanaerobaculia bacterium]|nr:phosphoribosylanthranilate isomerase [Thermoanaerobaculia bacterium]